MSKEEKEFVEMMGWQPNIERKKITKIKPNEPDEIIDCIEKFLLKETNKKTFNKNDIDTIGLKKYVFYFKDLQDKKCYNGWVRLQGESLKFCYGDPNRHFQILQFRPRDLKIQMLYDFNLIDLDTATDMAMWRWKEGRK